MTVALYFDEHIPKAIVEGLRQRGVDVCTVQEDGQGGLNDPSILDRAGELERVLFTFDHDFLAEATRRQRAGIEFTGIVFARATKITIRQCIDDLEIISGAGEFDELSNQVQYLPWTQ